jgi:hypothetical protein
MELTMNILKTLFGTPQYVSRTDTTANSPNPNPNDIWIFTDPDARDMYTKMGKTGRLAHDIQYEVMRGQHWLPEELEYKQEIRRLLREGTVSDKGTYWYTSPFPTVYRAICDGSLTISGNNYHFRTGDDIVFQCRMTREQNSDLTSPVLVADLQPTDKSMLCGQMGGAMKGTGH